MDNGLTSFTNFLSFELIITAIAIGTTTLIAGVFLVMQRKALLSDATAHAVLLGIVISFLVLHNLSSPLLLLGAALAGMAAMLLAEVLQRVAFVRADSAMVLAFSLFFSLALILINSLGAHRVHLDEDVVILGELAFTPFMRTVLLGGSLPSALVQTLVLLAAELLLLRLCYKELLVSSLDANYAVTLGLPVRSLNLTLIWLSSLAAVNAMQNLGTLITVAFFVLPPAAGILTGKTPGGVLLKAWLFLIGTIPLGYIYAASVNVSISGSMAFVMGCVFLGLAALQKFSRLGAR